MEKIKREIKVESNERYEVDAFGFNSKGTLTIACKNGTLFNINGVDLEILKKFINKL